MTAGNGRRPPRDALDTAQLLVLDITRRVTEGGGNGGPAWVKPEIGLQLATAAALVDIARSLRSLEGYLCNRDRAEI